MKFAIIAAMLLLIAPGLAAQDFPGQLQGTWQMEKREIFEHWDSLAPGKMMGFSYKMVNGQMKISEYLSLESRSDGVVYTATVIGQNHGQGIEFRLRSPDAATWIFENPEHDFPQQITYQMIEPGTLMVTIAGKDKSFSYKLLKRQ